MQDFQNHEKKKKEKEKGKVRDGQERNDVFTKLAIELNNYTYLVNTIFQLCPSKKNIGSTIPSRQPKQLEMLPSNTKK